MISQEILKKYNMKTLEEYKEDFGDSANTELLFYQTFLIQTDHIPNKIIESQALGNTPEDYTEILTYRQYARDEVNKLNV
mgnify:CR=1 FL=1